MKILTVTLENRNLLKDYIDLGVNEVVLASADNTFSALHEFTGEEIKEIVEECHMHHMTVTVLMNRLYSEKDIYAAQKEMEEILHLGVDGLMFADPGLLKYAKEKHLESYLTYRPETLMTCNEDALFWKEQGLRSVVIPCLLTKDEVMDIAKYTPDTTVIIHGSTLMSVSKRKLLSAYKEEVYDVIPLNISAFIPKEYDRDKCLNECVKLLKKYTDEKPEQKMFGVLQNGESAIIRLCIDSILVIRLVNNVVVITTENGDLTSSDRSLRNLKNELSPLGFFRICSNILVNVNKVYEVLETEVVLKNGAHLPVSRRRRKELLTVLSRIISAKVTT